MMSIGNVRTTTSSSSSSSSSLSKDRRSYHSLAIQPIYPIILYLAIHQLFLMMIERDDYHRKDVYDDDYDGDDDNVGNDHDNDNDDV